MVDVSALEIETVWFKRSKGSPEEHGVLLGGDKVIIDMLCKPVDEVWSWGCDYEIRVVYRPPPKNFVKKGQKKQHGKTAG